MATVTKKNVSRLPDGGHVNAPYGNLTALHFNFTTNASGILVDSDKAAAIAAEDVVRLGILPAGMKLLDAKAIVSNTFSDGSTFDLGFLYVDGVDVTAAAQDADYFFDAADYHDATAILTKSTTHAPKTLAKDAYLVLTNNTAAQAEAGVMDIFIFGELMGPK